MMLDAVNIPLLLNIIALGLVSSWASIITIIAAGVLLHRKHKGIL